MKKISVLILTALLMVSCGEEIEFNNPALQGNKDGVLWRANVYDADIDNGALIVKGSRNLEAVWLLPNNDNRGTYELGGDNDSEARYIDPDGVVYSTKFAPDPSVQVYPADGQIVVESFDSGSNTVTGNFWFNAFTEDGLKKVNFNQGDFYRIRLNGGLDGGTVISCDEAVVASALAATTYNATSTTSADYPAVCNAYKTALTNQITSCGDDTNVLQDIIDGLGTCTTTTATLFINGTLDGVAFNTQSDDIYGSSMSYSPQYDGTGACIDINYEPSLYPTFDDTQPNLGVGFIGFIDNAGLSCSDELANFDTLFPVATYDYAPDASGYGSLVTYYTGTTTAKYYLSYGAQDATASFEITEVTTLDCAPKECLIISGTFSCRLYNETDATDFIDVVDGEFRLEMSSFN